MKLLFLIPLFLLSLPLSAQNLKSNVPYAEDGHTLHMLDIYAPSEAKNLPVAFWIHGGGWEQGDKGQVVAKPQWFMDHGFVFVSINYRLLPEVDMGTLIRDVAMAFGWVEKHIADYGGDPHRVFVGGHSAGAQLAAILCTDERYLKEQGVGFDVLIGCMPVDGDTFNIPAIIEIAETRSRVYGLPLPKFGHRVKFGNDPAKHRDFSAVTHVAKGKGIQPFMLVYVAAHPDTSAQAQHFASVLKQADVPVTLYGAKNSWHVKVNDDLGLANDPGTKVLAEFVEQIIKH